MRKYLLAAVLIGVLLPLGALDLAREEIESAGDRGIVFVNYEGPQSRIESAAAITGIGLDLGTAIGAPGSARQRSGDLSRYAVIRAVDAAVIQGFDADIIVLGPGAQVDHIRNLRRIVAGYLESAWGYSKSDAATLAVFITVYNAVHRGDLDYFGSRYKAVVLKELNAENAGLALRWDQWAGKSRIVVPLSSGARPGSLGAVDTGLVSDKNVTESLRAEPDKGIGDRQALVDIKEREVEEKKSELEQTKAEIAQDETKLAAEKERLSAERSALEADKAAAVATTTTEGAAPETGAATSETGAGPGQSEQAELAVREAELAAEEEKAAAAETALHDKKTEAAATEAAIAAKESEIAHDRATVSQDQKEVIAGEVAAAAQSQAAGIYLFEVVDTAYPFARIVYLDPQDGKILRASTLNSIRARSIVEAGEAFVAIAGKTEGSGAVRLVKIDKASLESLAEGESDIFPESALVATGGSFYAALTGAEGATYLGRFGDDLAEAARSTEAVNPYGFLASSADGLIAQSASGGFILLDPTSLELVRRLTP